MTKAKLLEKALILRLRATEHLAHLRAHKSRSAQAMAEDFQPLLAAVEQALEAGLSFRGDPTEAELLGATARLNDLETRFKKRALSRRRNACFTEKQNKTKDHSI